MTYPKISKIVLEIDGKELFLSLDDALILRDALNRAFPEQTMPWVTPYPIPIDRPSPWVTPYPIPIDRPVFPTWTTRNTSNPSVVILPNSTFTEIKK